MPCRDLGRRHHVSAPREKYSRDAVTPRGGITVRDDLVGEHDSRGERAGGLRDTPSVDYVGQERRLPGLGRAQPGPALELRCTAFGPPLADWQDQGLRRALEDTPSQMTIERHVN